MKNIWNVKDVQAIISEVESLTGESLDLEVKENGRLTRALARCLTRVVNGRHIPITLEFGKTILNVSDYEIFKQITLHEIAHAIANKKHQDNCNHDSRFIKVCQEIGCYNTGAYCSEEYSLALQQANTRISQTEQLTKYSVICENCGHVYHKSRACDLTRNTSNYRCSCSGKLKLKQNW